MLEFIGLLVLIAVAVMAYRKLSARIAAVESHAHPVDPQAVAPPTKTPDRIVRDAIQDHERRLHNK